MAEAEDRAARDFRTAGLPQPGLPHAGLPHSVALELASNLRDLGGYATAAGRRIRSGLLYRSAALPRLSEADRAIIAGLGLRTVCDFRGERERAAVPIMIPGAQSVSLPVEPIVGAGLRDIMETREATGADLMSLLRGAYEDYAIGCHAQFGRLFARVLAPGALPLMFHCSAGKDRTGFATALLMTALGVDAATIMDDYLATNRLWRRDTVPSRDFAPDLKQILLGAHAELLEAAFAAIRREYGTVDAYFETALGLDRSARGRLRDLLLEPGAA